MTKQRIALTLSTALLVVVGSMPAMAGHDHLVETPNGKCHQVAKGQTAIDDETHGGYHRFHANVHIGATDDTNRDLGKGHSMVNVYKDACP